jgi:plasmid maintenance system antidote protein VapI
MARTAQQEPALSQSWLASRLGTQPAKIAAMRRAGQLIGIPAEDGSVLYPSWQFGSDGKPLPVLPRLRAAAERAGIDERRLNELLTMRSGLTSSHRLADALGTAADDEIVAAIERAR